MLVIIWSVNLHCNKIGGGSARGMEIGGGSARGMENYLNEVGSELLKGSNYSTSVLY